MSSFELESHSKDKVIWLCHLPGKTGSTERKMIFLRLKCLSLFCQIEKEMDSLDTLAPVEIVTPHW